MKRFIVSLLTGLAAWSLTAQEDAVLRAAMYLSGASSEEEIPADWVERLEGVSVVRINADHLMPGLLLSDYQVASIRDYRAASGDILSWEELSLLDGFSPEAVAALRPFLSLYSSRLPGVADTVRVHGTALVRTTLSSVGAKAKVMGENWRAGAAWRGRDGSFYGETRIRQWRVIAGDFHCKWGQGLVSWTGFSMENLSTLDAFVRRSTGLSPANSYTSASTLRGAAGEYAGRRFRASAYAAQGGRYGLHGDWLARKGQLGMSAVWDGGWNLGLDGKYNISGADLSGELALRKGAFGGKVSARWKMGESWKGALQGRVLPSRFTGKKSGEYALAMGTAFTSGRWQALSGRSGFGSSVPCHKASLTLDAALLPIPGTASGAEPRRFQLRAYSVWQWQISPVWSVDLRLTERYRNYEFPRSDARLDVKAASGPWQGVFRTELVHCEKWGFLTYAEGGYKADRFWSYLRLSAFSTATWNDRIYCYERDAPGTFSVPALSGTGLMGSLVGSGKFRLRRLTLRVYARAACTIRRGNTPAPALNLQLQVEF